MRNNEVTLQNCEYVLRKNVLQYETAVSPMQA